MPLHADVICSLLVLLDQVDLAHCFYRHPELVYPLGQQTIPIPMALLLGMLVHPSLLLMGKQLAPPKPYYSKGMLGRIMMVEKGHPPEKLPFQVLSLP